MFLHKASRNFLHGVRHKEISSDTFAKKNVLPIDALNCQQTMTNLHCTQFHGTVLQELIVA
jgi:hypothetical protein